jgi:hypothetical protein
MDDDLQHRPETIPTLSPRFTDDVDLVYGHSDQEEHDRWRNMSSRFAKFLMGALSAAAWLGTLVPFGPSGHHCAGVTTESTTVCVH